MSKVRIATRFWVALMIFVSVFVNYTMRVNLSINIVEMAPSPVSSNETGIESLPVTELKSLGWSTSERGLVLSSYFWGYIVANLVGGPVSEKFGPRRVMFITSLVGAVLTMGTPAAAKLSYQAMVIARIALGFCGGFMGPAVQALIAHWAVPSERGRFMGALVGGTVSTVITWSLCGIIIELYGWEWAFYVFGIMTAAFCISWLIIVHDTPEIHTWISESEKKFILDGTTVRKNNKQKTPYLKIITSVPVWALTIALGGSGWGTYFVITAAPMFIANVLNYNIAATGFLSAAIYVIKCTSAIGFGFIGDILLKKKLLSLRMLRKSFIIFSHIIPGCFLLSLTVVDDAFTAICLIAVAMAFHSAQTATTTGNCQDLAPNFAATVFGLPNAGTSLAGIYTPLIVAYFTKGNERSFEAWQPVFYTGAFVYIVSGAIFIIFGSTEIQPWNNATTKPCEDAETVK